MIAKFTANRAIIPAKATASPAAAPRIMPATAAHLHMLGPDGGTPWHAPDPRGRRLRLAIDHVVGGAVDRQEPHAGFLALVSGGAASPRNQRMSPLPQCCRMFRAALTELPLGSPRCPQQ